MTRQRPLLESLLLSALLLASISSCGGSIDGPYAGPGPAPGSDPPPDPPSDTVWEWEPNDHNTTANYLGELRVGDRVVIEGDITECCPDPYDGFAFYAAEPIELTIVLTEYDPADLDFCVYDPYLDEIIACWETDEHPEWGIFSIGVAGDFQLVISSYFGDSAYSMEVTAAPLPPGPSAPGSGGRNDSAPGELALERFAAYHDSRPERDERRFLLLKDGEEEYLLPLSVEELSEPGPESGEVEKSR